MSETLVLSRVSPSALAADPWLQAVQADYAVPENAHVFAGRGLQSGERVAFWIGEDGGGFGAVCARPEDYVLWSSTVSAGHAAADAALASSCPDEFEFEPGTHRYAARELRVAAALSFGF